MLILEKPLALPEFDRQVFDIVVPANHYLRQVAERIDFERFRPRLIEAYSVGMGRPAIDPVRMFKILFLRFHYKLSDRQVMGRIATDMAFRWFLDLPLHEKTPNHTDGTYFRKRIGAERFTEVFQDLITQAREAGLVKDRLRLKDATHLIADAADVQPLQLAAQVRERLLRMATPFFADWVIEQRAQIETLRQTTAEFADDEGRDQDGDRRAFAHASACGTPWHWWTNCWPIVNRERRIAWPAPWIRTRGSASTAAITSATCSTWPLMPTAN